MARIGKNCWTDCSRALHHGDAHKRRGRAGSPTGPSSAGLRRTPPGPRTSEGAGLPRPAPSAFSGRSCRLAAAPVDRCAASPMHADRLAPRSSTSTARCCGAPAGRCSPRRCAPVGLLPDRSHPGRGLRLPALQRDRRDPAGDAAHPPGGAAWPRAGPRAAVQAAGEPAAERLIDQVPAVRQAADRPSTTTPGRQVVLATTSPYDLVQAARRRARPRRRHRHPLRRARRRLRRHASTAPFVWGPGKLARGAGVGGRATASTSAESYAYSDSFYDTPLLGGRRPPGRRQPRPAPAAHGRRPGAGRSRLPRRARRASPSSSGIEPQQAHAAVRPPAAVPVRALRHRRHRAHPADGPGDPRRQPPQLLRPAGDRAAPSPSVGRPVRFLGKKEVFDAPVVGQLGHGHGRHPRRARHRVATSRCEAAADALEAGRAGGDHAAGHDPARPRPSSTRSSRAGGARPGWRAMTKAPVIPIGLWGTEKVWPRTPALPNVLNVARPADRAGPGRAAGRAEATAALDADTKRIMAAIVDLLPPSARRRTSRRPRSCPVAAGLTRRAIRPQAAPRTGTARWYLLSGRGGVEQHVGAGAARAVDGHADAAADGQPPLRLDGGLDRGQDAVGDRHRDLGSEVLDEGRRTRRTPEARTPRCGDRRSPR